MSYVDIASQIKDILDAVIQPSNVRQIYKHFIQDKHNSETKYKIELEMNTLVNNIFTNLTPSATVLQQLDNTLNTWRVEMENKINADHVVNIVNQYIEEIDLNKLLDEKIEFYTSIQYSLPSETFHIKED